MTAAGRALAGAFALAAALLAAGAGMAAESTAGRLLVATEEMPDPRFAETVIYMVRDDGKGALGLVLNRPLYDAPVADLLRGFGLDPGEAAGTVRVLSGGPVEHRRGFALHDADYATEDTLAVGGGIAFTPGPEPLADSAAGKGPARLRFFLGVAGWGPGQLEGELAAGGWAVVPADPAIVFDDDFATKWERAIAARGIDL